MDSTVVVLDLETNGLLSGGFVQPLQIGVVRHALDEEGCISPNEMSAVLLPVKLLPDFTVAPDAQALTGLDGAVGRTEYEVAQLLHAALNAPKTTVIAGYNIASFDNTVLRFMFWRNGLPVYTHERRVVDVFPMVAAMAALGLGLVALPENGGLKLEHIAEANDNFGVEGDAHNALFDTRVTVALLMRLMSDATMKTIEDANFDTFREYRAMAAWPRLGKGNYPYGRFGVGGLPRGRVIEIYGPESSGKTTLCQHVIAEAQRMGGICAFVDMEHALDPNYAARCGVDIDNLYVSQPDTGEQALEIAEALIRSGTMDVVVIDSVAALVPRAEIEGEMGDAHVGLQARLMSQALRKMSGVIKQTNTIVIFTNQLREKIGVMFGNPETTPGGNALKFYASVRLDIRRMQAIKAGADTVRM
jgi:DNA polymerase III epsilon subunit-like protein/Ni2+-binding GTPase involved in maturation of urease and hydrogenase